MTRRAPARAVAGGMRPAGDLPALCRPAGWVALWRRLAATGARDARAAG